MNDRANYHKQAILIIHGIGEQKQHETLRTFVQSMVGDDFIYSPVQIDQTRQTSRLIHFSDAKQTRYDFYEYYWAANFRDTNYRQVFKWLKDIFSKKAVPFKLTLIKVLIELVKSYFFAFIVMSAVILVIIIGEAFASEDFSSIEFMIKIYGVVNLIFSSILFLLGNVVLFVIGDVARYLHNSPENIKSKDKVETEGIQILGFIHDQQERNGDPKYDQVKVVGHSLGSIIGYQILIRFWAKKSGLFRFSGDDKNTIFQKLATIYQLSAQLKEKPSKADYQIAIHTGIPGALLTFFRWIMTLRKDQNALTFPLSDPKLTLEYQKAQEELQADPAIHKVWRITDFITLGSPLHYSNFLIANDNKEWFERVNQMEFPSSPPVVSSGQTTNYNIDFTDNDDTRFHHAAVFLPTKWSNIFYRGDIIAGELNYLFGQGINDQKATIKKGKKVLSLSPASHTKYWDATDEVENDAIDILKAIFKM